ncbi:MAG: esterase [Candidatus Eremiobacteraeota bacterium]|nr:esterase [Candidatus Eremiobacteraeota bacterium]MBV9263722.1 esterase [Candidatus Eremiobacteraeota bacterium]
MHRQSEIARLLGLAGDVRVDTVSSEALRGNPLGDPAERPVIVYLPDGYDASAERRYPAIYVLHGYTGDAVALVAARPWETNVLQWADRLMREKRMPQALVVLVDGFTRLGGSQYVDSIHNGDYATYVVRDVIGHVDRSYRTIASEGGRAVVGKSSGGFGAMHLVIEHAGTFAAFASHSGDAYFRYAHLMAFPIVHRTLEAHGFDIPAFVQYFEERHKRSHPEYTTMEMLAYAAAYSPRSATAFDLDLPFDRATGELRDDVFDRWLAFDPALRATRARVELERLRLRYLDCGRQDEYHLDIGARAVAARIRELGLDVRHEEFDDDHRNIAYRYEVSLPALANVLDRE